MKSIMISINPKWVEKIATGEKTIELRKSSPKETPFKSYIYETKSKGGKGKVVGEFVCARVEDVVVFEEGLIQNYVCFSLKKSCVDYDDIVKYVGNGNKGKALYIQKLKIYDTPKELSDFKMPYKYDTEGFIICSESICPYYDANGNWSVTCSKCKTLKEKYQIKRPPQSWCYCEVQE